MRGKPTEPTTRLWGLVAARARVAVVFRRGPSKQVRLALWDLATDQLTYGQWLSGRIYNERCGLSPGGKLLVYFAGKFKTRIPTFTALSRPPYFTALALWPDGSTWGGGGFFEDDRRLVLNYGRVIDELNGGKGIPADFCVTSVSEHRERHAATDGPEASQGWTLKERGSEGERDVDPMMAVVFTRPWIQTRVSPRRPRLTLERWWLGMFEVNGPHSVYSFRLVETPKGAHGEPAVEELGRLDWADWDHDGSLLFSRDGCLFRRNLTGGPSEPMLIADLRDQTFANLRPPPEALVWP